MATIQSLGLREPSALSYLISESILPPDPAPNTYKWQHQFWQRDGVVTLDEVLTANNTVVWSRNGTINRLYNLQVEGEPLLHAFVTHFVNSQDFATTKNSEQHSSNHDRLEAALVVILKTQAHIYLLSGDTHVLPLPFQTQAVFPLPHGFVLQRKALNDNEKEDIVDTKSHKPAFKGSQLHVSERKSTRSVHDDNLHTTAQGSKSNEPEFARSPRTYSYTDILSDLGLVVSGSARRPCDLNECRALPADEEILYVSTSDELDSDRNSRREPLYVALTVNAAAASLNIWQVIFSEANDDPRHDLEHSKAKKTPRRKSSNVFISQTGVATPIARGPGTFRESFGGLAQSLTDSFAIQSSKEANSRQVDDLAAQLGHEFQHTGVQTRSARRVSSMLARTDLGGTAERNTFAELSLGPSGRKSLGTGNRRVESLGGISDRHSFGRRRSSFQANSSVFSEGTSFLDIPATHLLDDDLNVHNLIDQDDDLVGDTHRYLKEIGFMKLKSIHIEYPHTHLNVSEVLRVTTMLAPDKSTADERRSRILSIYVLHRATKEMTVVNLAIKPQLSSTRSASITLGNEIKAVGVHRNHEVVDICKVKDGVDQRLLTLTHTRDGRCILQLEAPWSPSFTADLPSTYKVFETWTSDLSTAPQKRQDVGIRRIIAGSNVQPIGFASLGGNQEILLIDTDERIHALRMKLAPTDPLVHRILQMANFIFVPETKDSLLVAWWEVRRWLDNQGHNVNDEWTVLTITIFLLAVPFISKTSDNSKVEQRRTKGATYRSTSGKIGNLDHWNRMNQIIGLSKTTLPHENSPWQWLRHGDGPQGTKIGSLCTTVRSSRTSKGGNSRCDDFLIRCSTLAREFIQSPVGEHSIGPEGYLPISMNKDRTQRRTALASMLVGLHLLREEQKLDTNIKCCSSTSPNDLALIISQLAMWLQWPDWSASRGTYYGTELRSHENWLYDDSVLDSLDTPPQPFGPPSVFAYVEEIIVRGSSGPFLSLLDLIAQSRHISSTHPLYRTAVSLTPRMFTLISFLGSLKDDHNSKQVIDLMISHNIDRQMVHSLPEGIAAVFHKAVSSMRAEPISNWSAQAYMLLDRYDLMKEYITIPSRRTIQPLCIHESVKDHRAITNTAIDADTISKWDASSEIDRQTVTKLIFREDRRFQEASKMVNQTRPPVVECVLEAGWTESDLLDAQKELAQHVSRRTFSVSAGRGMMHFNARVPLLTERVPIPAFTPQCVIKPSGASDHAQPMTFSADKALFTEEKTCWAFFHNGASAGLMISRNAKWIDTSWILYNKPSELTNRHAGFLLALGLNGHLISLAKWVAFKYLTPKHTMTSVGLLLGLAASYIGTSDTLITRLLSVHVTRLLPPGAAELNLSPLTQTAGLMGIGLLYHASQHRRMSEVMLSELENSDAEERSGEDPILRDEGYRLAAGFSLGLMNLGHGGKLHSLHDMSLTERLLAIAIGPKNVNLVHVLDRATAGSVIAIGFIYMKTNDAALAQKIDIPDTPQQFEYVRPDIFLLRTLARHLIMWDGILPSKAFIRTSLPQNYRRRAELKATKHLSTEDLPLFNIIAGICFAISLRFAGSHRSDVRDLLVAYLDQFWRLSKLPALNYDSKVTLNSVRNCLDVLALSCATVMAGSGDLTVLRRLRALHGRTDSETPFGSHLAAHMALGALFLSGGTATFATSNLAIASLVIAFYPVFPNDILDNRGHLQALRHFWVLAVDDRCLVSRDSDTGQVIGGIEAQVTLIDGTKTQIWTPGLLPDLNSISRIHFNHDSYWPVDLALSSPTLAQDGVDTSSSKSSHSHSKHRTLRDGLKTDPTKLSIPLLRRSAYEKPRNATSVFINEVQALDTTRGIPSLDASAVANEGWKNVHAHTGIDGHARDPFGWIFGLKVFQDLDHTEKALVLERGGGAGSFTGTMVNGSGRKLLHGTVVDTRLELEMGILGLDSDGQYDGKEENSATKEILPASRLEKDRLWQLRLLLAWSERWDKEAGADKREAEATEAKAEDVENHDENNEWLRREVIERLRWRIWKMASGDEAEDNLATG